MLRKTSTSTSEDRLTCGLNPPSTACQLCHLLGDLPWFIAGSQHAPQLIQSSVLDGSYFAGCQAEYLCCVFAAQTNQYAQYQHLPFIRCNRIQQPVVVC